MWTDVLCKSIVETYFLLLQREKLLGFLVGHLELVLFDLSLDALSLLPLLLVFLLDQLQDVFVGEYLRDVLYV